MAIFNYIALENKKNVVKGKVEAKDIKEARENVRKMGFLPTKVVAEGALLEDRVMKKDSKKKKIPRLGLDDKIEFTSTFQILAQSGIPVIESLVFMENDAAKLKIRVVSKELRKQIIGGTTFADAVAKYPEIFGQIYIGLVKAGEDSGELEKTLERLLEILKKEAAVKSKVIGTLMYPIFTILLAMVVVTVMLVFVFPTFAEMFENMGKELPWITAMMMTLGVFLKEHWIFIPIIFITVFGGGAFLFKWETSRRIIDDVTLKIPLVSDFAQFSDFANFISVMQVAYDAGVPIVDTLYLSNLTLSNYTLKDKISLATMKVQQGQHLSLALRTTKVMPKMILFMIATGEQSGRLGDMLGQAVNYIDKKLDAIVDAMTKMIEPIMLVVIGGIVLVMALALYLPLFQSYIQD